MNGRRGSRLAWTTAVVGLALGPFLLAGMAWRVSIPRGSGSAANDVPALPNSAHGEGDLFASLRPLPLLVTNLPDRPSREAVEIYRDAGILEPYAVRAAFEAAWAALVVDKQVRAELLRFAGVLDDPTSTWYGALPHDLLEALVADPDNADRLVNAAAMLFAYGMLFDSGLAVMPDTGGAWYFGQGSVLESRAGELLASVGELFGPSQAQLVNQAFVESLAVNWEAAVDLAANAVALGGDEITPRLLLADLQARDYDDARGWDKALVTLAPLLDDPRTEVLGRAARGDVFLVAASLRSYETPRTARALARLALQEYDLVLGDVADAGVYAGRARALALLGELDAARESMDRALELAPTSIDLQLAAAGLAEADGDVEAMREAAHQAFGLASDGWNPSIAAVRFVPGPVLAHPGDLGLFGASIGSTLDHVGTYRITEGGGLLFDLEVVPRVIDPDLDLLRRSGFAPDVAALTALQASVSLGDPDTAEADYSSWYYRAPYTSLDRFDYTYPKLQTARWAAQLTATREVPVAAMKGGSGGDVIAEAEQMLRRAGRFADLEELCAALFTPRDWQRLNTDVVNSSVDLLRCVGDAQMLGGDPETAARTYAEALRVDSLAGSSVGRDELLLHRAAALLATAPGDRQALTDLQRVAAGSYSQDQRVNALILLAADDLLQGDVAVARAHYDLALAILGSDAMFSDDAGGRAQVRQALVTALTNRGVVALRLAQDDPHQPPRCDAAEHREACDQAAADFDAALDIDPLNAITLMNLGWVARSRADTADARAALSEATVADPTLYPAFNDLGVLAARAGDREGARVAFEAAVTNSPGYALGWWNLGVLELDGGLGGARVGQAALTRAIELDSSLAGRPVDYRTDEAVYRATFAGLEEVSSSWPVSRTYGLAATVLGAVGLLTALGRLGRSFVGDVWPTLARAVVTNPKLAARLRWVTARGEALRSRLPGWLVPWTPWLLTAIALAVVTSLNVWLREPGALLATLLMVALATGSALAVHEAAHVVALRHYGGRLVPAQWIGGIMLALLLLPVQASSGPYLAETIEGAPEDRLVRIHLVGPVANLGLAALAFGLFLLHPVPILLLTSQVSLAVCAYSLLSNVPLDGKPLVDHRPLLAAALGLVVTATGAAFVVGVG